MKNSKSFRSSLGLSLLFLSACARPAEVRAPVTVGEEVVRSINVGRAQMRTVKSEARVEFRKGGRRIRFHANILARFPDRIFVEASGFGMPACLASVFKNDVDLFVPAKNLYYRANASEGLQSVFGVAISSTEWVNLLLGYVPNLDRVESATQSAADWIITGTAGGEEVRMVVDQRTGWLKSYQSVMGKKKVSFGEPMNTPQGNFPSSIKVSTPEGNLEITFNEVATNPSIPDEHFNLEIPKGLKPHTLTKGETLIDE